MPDISMSKTEAQKQLIKVCKNARKYIRNPEAFKQFNAQIKQAESALKLLESQEVCNQPTVEHLNELYELSDEPTIQGNEFYLRGFKDRETWQTKPVEGDVRAESIELLKKELDAIYEGPVHAPKGMNMPVILIDALLSKFNFTRKG